MPTSSNPPQDVTMKPLMTSPRTPHHPPRTRPTCTHPRVCPLCTSCCNRDITMMSPFLALLLVAILNKLKRGTQLDNLAPILLPRTTYIYPNFQTFLTRNFPSHLALFPYKFPELSVIFNKWLMHFRFSRNFPRIFTPF